MISLHSVLLWGLFCFCQEKSKKYGMKVWQITKTEAQSADYKVRSFPCKFKLQLFHFISFHFISLLVLLRL